MYHLLLHHFERLVRYYNISTVGDFDNADCILYSPDFFEPIREKLAKISGIHEVRRRRTGSPAACFLQALLRMRPKWGINIFLSTLSPFYFTTFETPEGLKPLRMNLIYRGGLKQEPRWDAYLRSRKQKI